MKKEITCSIIRDILPNYIEKLTGDDTNYMVEQHLDTCESCKKAYELMASDMGDTEKVPVIELKFLKKVKRTRLLAAMLCVILTLVLSYMLYASEYKFTIDKGDLSSAVTEFTALSRTPIDAYVLETKEMNGVLVVSFKDQSNEGIYGIAEFLKGFNQRYRIVRSKIKPSDYSSVVQYYPVKIKDQPYIAVSGYNLLERIKFYGLDYATYSEPGTLSANRVMRSLKFQVKNPQFLEFYPVEELNRLIENSSEESLHNYYLVATSMYDGEAGEITEDYRSIEDTGSNASSGGGKAELFLLYVFIGIIMGVGFIFTRYFLT